MNSTTLPLTSPTSLLSHLQFPRLLKTITGKTCFNIHVNVLDSNRIQTLRHVVKPCMCSSSLSLNNRTTLHAHAAAVDEAVVDSATDVVRSFYDGINGGDLSSVEELISEDCVYEDLIFPSPFVGRKAILDFFKKFIDSISRDLQFVIDDISSEDSSALGVKWHLEWQGKPFPFSKGCSFYRLEIRNGRRQIVYGRDSVEPAIKPGETALVAIRGVTWLLQQFPQLADRL